MVITSCCEILSKGLVGLRAVITLELVLTGAHRPLSLTPTKFFMYYVQQIGLIKYLTLLEI